jgi:hypothetical protein
LNAENSVDSTISEQFKVLDSLGIRPEKKFIRNL